MQAARPAGRRGAVTVAANNKVLEPPQCEKLTRATATDGWQLKDLNPAFLLKEWPPS
jgi:hypothetical protein